MSEIEDVAAAHAEAYGLDLEDFVERVLAQARRRRERGEQPAKRCGSCRESRPALAFAEDTRQADGLKSTCRGCDAARTREGRRKGHRLGGLAD